MALVKLEYTDKETVIPAKNLNDIQDAIIALEDGLFTVDNDRNGEVIEITDAANRGFRSLNIYGKTTQDGTPSPEAPVELVSVGDSGRITVSVTGENKAQSMTIATPNGLPGIPVTSGGNYTDSSGQQWICDEIDFASGVYVKRVKQVSLGDVVTKTHSTIGTGNVVDGETVYINTTHENKGELERNSACLSDKLPNYPIFVADVEAVSIEGSPTDYSIRFRLKKSRLSEVTVQGVIDYLKENPIHVLHTLATPVETPLSEEELAAYAALHSYRDSTTVSNDAGAYMELEYVMDSKKYIDSLVAAPIPRLAWVTLSSSAWEGSNSPYSQVVAINGVTPYSKVDLLPSVEQLAIFHNKDVAFVTENEDGVVTVYAIGDKPALDYTMQVSIVEVEA